MKIWTYRHELSFTFENVDFVTWRKVKNMGKSFIDLNLSLEGLEMINRISPRSWQTWTFSQWSITSSLFSQLTFEIIKIEKWIESCCAHNEAFSISTKPINEMKFFYKAFHSIQFDVYREISISRTNGTKKHHKYGWTWSTRFNYLSVRGIRRITQLFSLVLLACFK